MKPLTSFSLWVGLLVPGVVGAQEVGSLGHLSPALRLSAEAADVIGSDPWLAGGTYTYSQAAFGLGGWWNWDPIWPSMSVFERGSAPVCFLCGPPRRELWPPCPGCGLTSAWIDSP